MQVANIIKKSSVQESQEMDLDYVSVLEIFRSIRSINDHDISITFVLQKLQFSIKYVHKYFIVID